jgi:hypothetical protein
MRPTKEQIKEAAKRGIVPGAMCKSPSGKAFICVDVSEWSQSGRHALWSKAFLIRSHDGKWAEVITPSRAKRKTSSQPDRIVAQFQAMREELERASSRAHQARTNSRGNTVILNRIEEYLNKVGQAVIDQGREFQSKLSAIESSVAVIRSGASFMQQLEQDAPKWTPKFGDRVMTPQGEGIYWRNNDLGCAVVAFYDGSEIYHMADLTPITP